MSQTAQVARPGSSPSTASHPPEIAHQLRAAFGKQRRAYLQDPVPGLEQRREHLQTLKRLLNEARSIFPETFLTRDRQQMDIPFPDQPAP